MKTKVCSKCKLEKKLSVFHKNKSTKDGFHCYCKECRVSKSIETLIKTNLLKQGQKQCSRCKKIKNLNEFDKHEFESISSLRPECKECRKIDSQIYYQNNKESCLNYQKEYSKLHKIELNQYFKKRRKKDINYKLKANLRTRIKSVLSSNSKSTSTLKLLGCNIEELKKYFESRFLPGMNWLNHGNGWNGRGRKEWHIDHIKPCASFDLSKSEEQKKCFHYTNLQPLWAKDNLEKHDKY